MLLCVHLQASQNAETRPSNGDVQRLRSAAVAAVLRTYYWDDEFRSEGTLQATSTATPRRGCG